jgi:hypothetical protein
VEARTRRGRNDAGLFVDRLKHRSCEPSTEERKKRTGFGSHPERRKRQASRGSGRGAAATMRGRSSIASNTGAANLQRKNAKSGQVLVRTREDKTKSIDYFEGGMSGVLNLS